MEVVIRRRDNPYVDADTLRTAHAFEAVLLKHAQEFRLYRGGHVADFVEKERAAVRKLELAGLSLDRARKGALLVAEKLAEQEVLGERRAVDAHEGAGAPVAGKMDVARKYFLACATLSHDENRGGAVLDAVEPCDDVEDRGGFCDDLPLIFFLIQLFFKIPVVAPELGDFEIAAHENEQGLVVNGL